MERMPRALVRNVGDSLAGPPVPRALQPFESPDLSQGLVPALHWYYVQNFVTMVSDCVRE